MANETRFDFLIGKGVIASRPAFGNTGALYVSTDETGSPLWYRDNGSSWDNVTPPGGSGGGALSYLTAHLSADVAMTTANSPYDGPSVSLSPGTWDLSGHAVVTSGASAAFVTAKLWDGSTNVVATGEQTPGSGGYTASVFMCGVVVVSSTTTFKITATGGANNILRAACPDYGAGNNATYIVAVKIG